jgi:hypothetical protein
MYNPMNYEKNRSVRRTVIAIHPFRRLSGLNQNIEGGRKLPSANRHETHLAPEFAIDQRFSNDSKIDDLLQV